MHLSGKPYDIVDISTLKPHEEVNDYRLEEIKASFALTNIIQKPIHVDIVTNTILNGHHRYFALLSMGYTKIPVIFRNYLRDDQITFSKSSPIQNKADVLQAAVERKLFSPKSTLHRINGEELNASEPYIGLSLDELKIKVMTVGVFDLFHYGHLRMLQRASSFTEEKVNLIVGVQTNVHKLKGVKPVYSIEDRLSIVSELRCVNSVHSYENVFEFYKEILPDVIVLGEDQNHEWFQMVESLHSDAGKRVVRLERTKDISTTKIKAELEHARNNS